MYGYSYEYTDMDQYFGNLVYADRYMFVISDSMIVDPNVVLDIYMRTPIYQFVRMEYV